MCILDYTTTVYANGHRESTKPIKVPCEKLRLGQNCRITTNERIQPVKDMVFDDTLHSSHPAASAPSTTSSGRRSGSKSKSRISLSLPSILSFRPKHKSKSKQTVVVHKAEHGHPSANARIRPANAASERSSRTSFVNNPMSERRSYTHMDRTPSTVTVETTTYTYTDPSSQRGSVGVHASSQRRASSVRTRQSEDLPVREHRHSIGRHSVVGGETSRRSSRQQIPSVITYATPSRTGSRHTPGEHGDFQVDRSPIVITHRSSHRRSASSKVVAPDIRHSLKAGTKYDSGTAQRRPSYLSSAGPSSSEASPNRQRRGSAISRSRRSSLGQSSLSRERNRQAALDMLTSHTKEAVHDSAPKSISGPSTLPAGYRPPYAETVLSSLPPRRHRTSSLATTDFVAAESSTKRNSEEWLDNRRKSKQPSVDNELHPSPAAKRMSNMTEAANAYQTKVESRGWSDVQANDRSREAVRAMHAQQRNRRSAAVESDHSN